MDQKKAEQPSARNPTLCSRMGCVDRSSPGLSGIPGLHLCQWQPQITRQYPQPLSLAPSHPAWGMCTWIPVLPRGWGALSR